MVGTKKWWLSFFGEIIAPEKAHGNCDEEEFDSFQFPTPRAYEHVGAHRVIE